MLTSGDVVMVDLGSPEGREAAFRRPAVVVTAQRVLDAGASLVHVAPITSRRRGFASEVEVEADPFNGLDRRSAVQCQHVRAIAVSRMTDRRGNVGSTTLAQIRDVLGLMLDIPS